MMVDLGQRLTWEVFVQHLLIKGLGATLGERMGEMESGRWSEEDSLSR